MQVTLLERLGDIALTLGVFATQAAVALTVV